MAKDTFSTKDLQLLKVVLTNQEIADLIAKREGKKSIDPSTVAKRIARGRAKGRDKYALALEGYLHDKD